MKVKPFPIQVFEDIKKEDFKKHNKKNESEAYVVENFKELGWRIYRPFNDTGIDFIASKLVCPNGHTQWNEKINDNNICPKCNTSPMEIWRFIQVKTREIKEDDSEGMYFGYTLKSKDFRTDPRHVFLLYSDFTNDFIIIPIYEYMKIFYRNKDMGKSHFAVPSFRKGNNKLNSLKYINNSWKWVSRKSKVDFDNFLNEKGMALISSPSIDKNLDKLTDLISRLRIKLFYQYSDGRKSKDIQEEKKVQTFICNTIKENLKTLNNTDINKIALKRKKLRLELKKNLSSELLTSINEGYFVKFKGINLLDE